MSKLLCENIDNLKKSVNDTFGINLTLCRNTIDVLADEFNFDEDSTLSEFKEFVAETHKSDQLANKALGLDYFKNADRLANFYEENKSDINVIVSTLMSAFDLTGIEDTLHFDKKVKSSWDKTDALALHENNQRLLVSMTLGSVLCEIRVAIDDVIKADNDKEVLYVLEAQDE